MAEDPSRPLIEVISIFPDYFAPLDLSLVGKARAAGLVDLRVHDLREVATDRHRTVDDAPLGGGAGMVMRPDVWWRALQERAEESPARSAVVLIPTPSGEPLTQARASALAAELARADRRAVIACGRYEGIDARLADRLRGDSGVHEVVEFSLGDYVLNGGEVAALALIEAVVRLLPGVLGNPESLAEESFTEPLLEYPVYTRPADWDGLAVPPVLLSGNHAQIERWRREQSLRRTARRRPELLAHWSPADLSATELAVLREEWVLVTRDGRLTGPLQVRAADSGDAAALADLAAITFPLACPGETTLTDVREHVERHLTAHAWTRHLDHADHLTLVLVEPGGELLGYALVLFADEQGADAAQAGVDLERSAELSKLYLLPRLRGTGAADLLMSASMDAAGARGLAQMWLGTNGGNVAAQRAYRRHGFEVVGERTFVVGGMTHHDVVMRADLAQAGGLGERPGAVAD